MIPIRNYPYTDFHDLNLDWLLAKYQDILIDIENLKRRMTSAEGRLDTAEANITSLTNRITTAENTIINHTATINGLTTSVNSILNSINTINTTLTNHTNYIADSANLNSPATILFKYNFNADYTYYINGVEATLGEIFALLKKAFVDIHSEYNSTNLNTMASKKFTAIPNILYRGYDGEDHLRIYSMIFDTYKHDVLGNTATNQFKFKTIQPTVRGSNPYTNKYRTIYLTENVNSQGESTYSFNILENDSIPDFAIRSDEFTLPSTDWEYISGANIYQADIAQYVQSLLDYLNPSDCIFDLYLERYDQFMQYKDIIQPQIRFLEETSGDTNILHIYIYASEEVTSNLYFAYRVHARGPYIE